MFERFTDRARKVMALANQEAQHLNHEYIGTEHILLGLVKEGSGVGANVLKHQGVDLEKVRDEVGKIIKSQTEAAIVVKLPQTPRAKKVVEYAIEEARTLGHGYIGTEHLLLGLLREREGLAAQVLMKLGLKLEDVRGEVLSLLGATAAPDILAASQELQTALIGLHDDLQGMLLLKEDAIKYNDHERAARLGEQAAAGQAETEELAREIIRAKERAEQIREKLQEQ